MDKPKNAIEGVGYGLKSTFTGIASGITGVFENPYQGAKKEGVVGFMKGTYKGVSGLVLKPVSGALDFFSKTSEGIKNTASSENKEVPKIRNLRPFYGKKQMIKVYDDLHAYILFHMMKIARGKYSKDHFIDAIIYATPQQQSTLVLTEEHLFMVDNNKLEVVKSFETSKISTVRKESNKFIKIYVIPENDGDDELSRRHQNVEPTEAIKLHIEDPAKLERYYKKLKNYHYHIQINSF
jgi:vacuolar protein sorting-associated protein 13A/C